MLDLHHNCLLTTVSMSLGVSLPLTCIVREKNGNNRHNSYKNQTQEVNSNCKPSATCCYQRKHTVMEILMSVKTINNTFSPVITMNVNSRCSMQTYNFIEAPLYSISYQNSQTLFQTKMAQKSYPLGPPTHTYIAYIREHPRAISSPEKH